MIPKIWPLTPLVPLWYRAYSEAPTVKKAKVKPQEEIIQSTLRLPRPLWEKINHIAVDKRLSMAQAVIQAISEYCKREAK